MRRSRGDRKEETSEPTAVEQSQPRPRRAGRLQLRGWRVVAVLAVVAGVAAILTLAGVAMTKWTETASFCGRCHTMTPELKAYAMSPHREVPCAECHVEPGVTGFIKAKVRGTKQLFEVVTGSFPKPIPPPDHGELPSVKDTCLKCHAIDETSSSGDPVKLVLRPRYRSDRANTRETIAILLRPAGLGAGTGTRGVHWHVKEHVEFASSDPRAQKIDWVGVSFDDGTKKQYLAGSAVSISSHVRPDIARIKRTEHVRTMDCIDCHNRAGHAIPSVSRQIDDAIAAGRIDRAIPYIKRDGVRLLSGDYASLAAADRAIAAIRRTYAMKYPLVLKMRGSGVTGSIRELKQIYRLVATPEMRVASATYVNNLGHQSSPGCFRCHDGGHYRVVGGRLTTETIPWACATCHTFPQVGARVSDVLFYGAPKEHKERLWVFNHRSDVASVDPAGTSCGACHTRTYCENCHNSGAVKVRHTEMLYRHAKAIERSDVQSCTYCHQPVYCMKCHKKNPFDDGGSQPAASGDFVRSPIPRRRP